MKISNRLIVSLVVILTLSTLTASALAAGETGTWLGLGPKSTITGTHEGVYKSATGGTMKFQIANGPTVGTFCTDLLHYVGTQYYASDEVMPCATRWLLLHYPPRLNDTWTDRPGALSSVGQEMAARQAAVWHFSDGFMPSTTTTVGARAWMIIEDVQAQADPCASDAPNVILTPSSTTEAVGGAVAFTVKVLQGSQPVAGRQVTLQASSGTLSTYAVTTDDNGEASFSLTSAAAGSSQITATAQMSLPVGTIFVGVEPNKQKLVLGEQTNGPVIGKATVVWAAGSTLVANVFNDLNMDGAAQDGEEGLSGWTISLQGATSKTSDAKGYVTWALPSGSYTVVLTQKTGYFATNPLTQTISLAQGEFATVNFGQIVPPVIKVKLFQDTNLDAAYDTNDAPLADWMVGLFRDNGSQAAGWNRATDAEGWVYFSTDPTRNPADVSPGDYYVQETLPQGWYATDVVSKSFSVASGEVHEEYLGNIQPDAGLEIAVSAGDQTPHFIHSGDAVTYLYRVTNTGNTYLRDVQVTDTQHGVICTLSGLLAPSDEGNCRYTTTITASETNKATVTGNPTLADGTPISGFANATQTDMAAVRVLHPSLAVTLSAAAQAYVGDTLEYTVVIENTGDADLTALTYAGPLTLNNCPTELAAGASASCTADHSVTADDVDTLTMDVSVSGKDSLGLSVSDNSSTATQVTFSDSDGDTLPDAVEGTGDTDGDGLPDYQDTDSDNDGISDAVEGTCDTDGDGTPDYLDTDSDGDGIPDAVEGTGDTDGDGVPAYLDTDSDGDGIPDAAEGTGNADADSVPNYLDTDSDDDGISDAIEGTSDADGDGIPAYLDADSDGDGIPDAVEGTRDTDDDGTPDYLDTDSDGDGIADAIEGAADADKDGTPNYLDKDSDGDGIPDAVEGIGDGDKDGVLAYLDTDSDGDGISDDIEGTTDADNDKTPNYLDTDSDGDGISDAVEGTGDMDKDGLPNYLDTDSDGDGISDDVEGADDANGTPAYLNTDSDGDGIPDAVEGIGDTDKDGIPNYLDTDSDGDSISDIVEGTNDTDDDGTPDYLDTDSDGDGILDKIEGIGNPDADSVSNYLDTDSDGDSIADAVEGTGDTDADGTPAYLDTDSDGDGISDALEGTADTDHDGTPNYLDADSDGDGVSDHLEGINDADHDGTPNYLDTDSDGDGIPDATEGTNDGDEDGVPDYLDTDSDGDGIPDRVEGTADTDHDGTPNYLDTDSDGDGIPDRVEGTVDTDHDGVPDYHDTDSDGDNIPDALEGTDDDDNNQIPNYLDPKAESNTIFLPLVMGTFR